MKKKLKKAISIFQWLLTAILVLVVLLLVFTAFNPVKAFQVFRVMSGSMEPKIKVGSVVFVQKVKPKILKKDDIITYTSADDALTAFRARHETDQLTLQALDELGGNPLDASLEIRAKDPSEYESIVNFVEASPTLSSVGTSIVDRINYAQNKEIIDRLSLAIQATREIGFAVIVFFAIASILIAFATIRLAIYTAKEEIAVMRLVGASNIYIQGPFIVTGVITGVIAAILILLLLWPATWYVGMKTAGWFGGFNIASYYGNHFAFIFSILICSGIVLGAIASVFAINRYLKT